MQEAEQAEQAGDGATAGPGKVGGGGDARADASPLRLQEGIRGAAPAADGGFTWIYTAGRNVLNRTAAATTAKGPPGTSEHGHILSNACWCMSRVCALGWGRFAAACARSMGALHGGGAPRRRRRARERARDRGGNNDSLVCGERADDSYARGEGPLRPRLARARVEANLLACLVSVGSRSSRSVFATVESIMWSLACPGGGGWISR